ncbi:peroxiredoxin [Firmicutes bacterium CAG:631]|nr:peroxiredoxin [Firmicutes bacterium CAG:631]
MLQINTIAPDFKLKNYKGEEYTLSQFKGKKVVLYFYPKNNTSGCTTQALEFKNVYDLFQKKNVVIIGISKDSLDSHQQFQKKYDFPFILLSDPSTETIQKYDVWKEKKLYGKTYMGVVRTTYIIDEQGVIIWAQEKVNPKTNASDVLCHLSK